MALSTHAVGSRQTAANYEEEGYGKGDWPRKRFIRRTKINFLGMSVMLCYLAALIFYIWVWPWLLCQKAHLLPSLLGTSA